MRAIVQRGYGRPDRVLDLVEIPKPAVGDNEVLVRVHSSSLHTDVWHVVTGRPYFLRLMGAGLRRPKNPVPGTDAAGLVEAVNDAITVPIASIVAPPIAVALTLHACDFLISGFASRKPLLAAPELDEAALDSEDH